MTIISILNPKGGCGKTTITTSLAHAFHDRGFRVLLVDSDPQGSASDWHAARDDNPLPFVAYGEAGNLKALTAIAAPYDYVFVDGAAKLEGMIAAAVKISDVVLIPVQPSPYDIWSAGDLVDLIRARQEVTEGRPQAAFVISRAIKRTVLGKEVISALSEYGMPVLQSHTVQRQSYPRSASEGRTVLHTRDAEAATEINNLADELISRFTPGEVSHVA